MRKRQNHHGLMKHFRAFPWILGGIFLGGTVDHLQNDLVQAPLTRQLGAYQQQFVMNNTTKAQTETIISSQNDEIHIVFSTSCSPSQNWQSYVFFFHAMQVGQPGEITRIVSGCNEREQHDLAYRHKVDIVEKMSDKFHIHFTPDYSRLGGSKEKSYKYFNKPFGLRHWMENKLGFPKYRAKYEHKIIAVLDPDMILMKPLLNNFTSWPMEAWNAAKPENKTELYAKRGYPIAQEYSYESHWKIGLGDNVAKILGNNSLLFNVSKFDARLHYPAGPPYILSALDLFDIVVTWSSIAPEVHKNYDLLLGEMYAYSIAAAHHGLKHQLAIGFMVSDPSVNREGWDFLKHILPGNVCDHQLDKKGLPLVLHYCQDYSVGDFHVSKFYIPDNLLSCKAPLLLEPPRDAAVKFNFSRTYKGILRTAISSSQSIRHAFMSCSLLVYLNQALTFYKQTQCGSDANFNKTWSRFKVSAS